MHEESKFSASEALTFWWWVYLWMEDASPTQRRVTALAIQSSIMSFTRRRKPHNLQLCYNSWNFFLPLQLQFLVYPLANRFCFFFTCGRSGHSYKQPFLFLLSPWFCNLLTAVSCSQLVVMWNIMFLATLILHYVPMLREILCSLYSF